MPRRPSSKAPEVPRSRLLGLPLQQENGLAERTAATAPSWSLQHRQGSRCRAFNERRLLHRLRRATPVRNQHRRYPGAVWVQGAASPSCCRSAMPRPRPRQRLRKISDDRKPPVQRAGSVKSLVPNGFGPKVLFFWNVVLRRVSDQPISEVLPGDSRKHMFYPSLTG